MKMIAAVGAAAFAAAVGFGAGRTHHAAAATANLTDEHAGHNMSDMAMPGLTQAANMPPSGATAAERLAKSPRHGEWVTIKNGADSVVAWVVYPERKDKAPVVIAIHENTGLNTWTRSVADELAAQGFIGVAPDLTTMSRTAENMHSDWNPTSDGNAAIQKVTADAGNAMIDAVARYAMALPAALPKYGIVGFCWGGGRSFLHATHAPGLGASVVYYGTPPSAELLANVKAPVLGFYGGNDARVTGTVPGTDTTMKKLGKSYAYNVMDGAGHGFLRGQEQSPANLAAAQAAWPKTVEFFREKLGK